MRIVSRARSSAACGALHAVAAAAGVALDQEADIDAVALAGFRKPARHHLVVEHDRHALEAPDQRGEPLGLGVAQHVVGEQDVVGDAGIRHHLDLAELLAGDADRAGVDLQLRQRRDLVRLDVRAVGEAVARERVLRALDVRLDDVEVDDNRGCIEIGDQSGHGVVNSRRWRAGIYFPARVPDVTVRKHVSLATIRRSSKQPENQGGTE